MLLELLDFKHHRSVTDISYSKLLVYIVNYIQCDLLILISLNLETHTPTTFEGKKKPFPLPMLLFLRCLHGQALACPDTKLLC